MKRNFGVRQRIDPKVRAFFPWALFLVFAILFALAAMATGAHAADAPQPSMGWTCETVRQYLLTHTEAEARAKAVELHLPKWLVRRAEKCIP
jgi:hypothetical protein